MTDDRFTLHCGDNLAILSAMPDRSVDLVFTSPPYENARTYGIKFRLKGQAWVDWLAERIVQCARVSKGLVCVNMSSPKEDGIYSGGVERLAADLIRWHGLVMPCSPYAWTKSAGIPGSGHKQWHRRDWEPVYAFCYPDRLPLVWSDNLAFGQPPKHGPGGEFSNRNSDGKRVNQWGAGPKSGKTRRANGKRQTGERPSHRTISMRESKSGKVKEREYDPPVIANPGNVIHTHVGGGMDGGDSDAHENEAPMPVALAERFVCWFCPPGGVVLDPFSGSGTTGVAAIKWGRKYVGIDVRESQVQLTEKRIRGTTPEMFP